MTTYRPDAYSLSLIKQKKKVPQVIDWKLVWKKKNEFWEGLGFCCETKRLERYIQRLVMRQIRPKVRK